MFRRIVFGILVVMALASAGVDWDAKMVKRGMVEVTRLDPTVAVDLRYATTNNFVGRNMYGTFCKAYLHADAAAALIKAQKALKKHDARYSIVIYDAARPQSVQRTMWNAVKGTANARYVARPERGGPHNYGIAVDVGLLYDGAPVDMGTQFDSFSDASHITQEQMLVKQGRISREALSNRALLRRVMTQAGFMTYRREWWHFELHRIKYARAHCRLLDF
ncbi:MAG: M15 family metallopeptidase [Bacteroidales bacterium]|nr:M15 family metallopeptidase [Bacteroidales bacterium]